MTDRTDTGAEGFYLYVIPLGAPAGRGGEGGSPCASAFFNFIGDHPRLHVQPPYGTAGMWSNIPCVHPLERESTTWGVHELILKMDTTTTITTTTTTSY